MTMSAEDVARRLRVELDGVPVPERPWRRCAPRWSGGGTVAA